MKHFGVLPVIRSQPLDFKGRVMAGGYGSIAQMLIMWIMPSAGFAWYAIVEHFGRQLYKRVPYHVVESPQLERDDCEMPKGRVRSCYRLNMVSTPTDIFDADLIGRDTESSIQSNNFAFVTPLQVAVQTSKIFNGVIVGNDGVILSQNKRSGNKLRGTVVPQGQSRQAVKIERMLKAADIEPMTKVNQEATRSTPPSQLLVVQGQYEDLHRLVSECAGELLEEKTLCWLPSSTLIRVSHYLSIKDIGNLSKSCKTVRWTLLEVNNRFRRRNGKRPLEC